MIAGQYRAAIQIKKAGACRKWKCPLFAGRGHFQYKASAFVLFFRTEPPLDFPNVGQHTHTVTHQMDLRFSVSQDLYRKFRDRVPGSCGAQKNLNIKRPTVRTVFREQRLSDGGFEAFEAAL